MATNSEEGGFCVYFSAGNCKFGQKCFRIHDAEKVLEKEKKWVSSRKIVEVITPCPQPFDYYIVLDLEGKDEIIELPAIILDARYFTEVSRFHRFVRPRHLFSSYSPAPGQDNPRSNSAPFPEVMHDFLTWVDTTCQKGSKCPVICGNWDVLSQIPKQSEISEIPLNDLWNSWINIKDVFLHHYSFEARGMAAMLKYLRMPLDGQHHLGMDDTFNIARVMVQMARNGAKFDVTGKRGADGRAIYTFADRIGRRKKSQKKDQFSDDEEEGGGGGELQDEAARQEEWTF